MYSYQFAIRNTLILEERDSLRLIVAAQILIDFCKLSVIRLGMNFPHSLILVVRYLAEP